MPPKAKRAAAPAPKAKGAAAPAPKRAAAKASAPDARKAPDKRKATAEASGAPPAKAAKGKPVDSAVPNKGNYSVVGDWSVLLNQTNVGANNNKYYKIQVLQSGSTYFCWTHWGRVGATGQFKLDPCGTSQAAAEANFKSKFRQKSSVPYEAKTTHDWTPKVGKYTLVETEEAEGDGGGGDAPLGKLTVKQIEKGQGVLKRIEGVVGKGDVKKMADLSSEFYTLIPHNFGFKVPPAITNKEMLETEQELLKFYLRMGFDESEEKTLSPVDGIMKLALPGTLTAAAGKLCGSSDIKASDDKGSLHSARQSGNPSAAMQGHLYAAIMLYTSNAIYRDLNAVLRSEDRTKIKKYFLYLRLLLEALARLPQQKRTLWRGVSVDLFDQYKVGSTITWWGVSSCTSDIKVAKNFMNGCGGKCSLITVESKTAADISAITFFGNEKENLVAPGTQLKVLSSKRNGNVTEIKVQEVGRLLK